MTTPSAPLPTLVPHQTAVTNFGPHNSTATTNGPDTQNAMNDDNENDDDGKCWYDESDYILRLARPPSSSSSCHVTCLLSNASLCTYDLNTMTPVHTIAKVRQVDHSTVTDLCYGYDHSANVVLTLCTDGRVRLFDLRTSGAPVTAGLSSSPTCGEFCLPEDAVNEEEAQCLTVGYGGHVLAVGTSGGAIHFWDLRRRPTPTSASTSTSASNKPVGSYVDAHRQEISTLCFSSSRSSSLLLSAAQDGLMVWHDTCQPTEEAALKSVMNVESPLRSAGFASQQDECRVYGLTGSETLSLWDAASAQRIWDGGDFRRALSEQAGLSSSSMPIAFHIGCHWDASSLWLLSGNANGTTLLTRVQQEEDYRLVPQIHLRGHVASVRDFVWFPPGGAGQQAPVLVTGGEDARLCVWNLQQAQEELTTACTPTTSTMLPGGPQRRRRRQQRQTHKKMDAPY